MRKVIGIGETMLDIIFKNGKTNDVLGVYATEDNTVYNTVMNAIEKDGAKIKFDGKSYSVENAGI